MDLSFVFGFDGILPVVPFKRFEGNKPEIQNLLEFRRVGILDKLYGSLSGLCDVGCEEGFAIKASQESDSRMVMWDVRRGLDTDAADGNFSFIGFHVQIFIASCAPMRCFMACRNPLAVASFILQRCGYRGR